MNFFFKVSPDDQSVFYLGQIFGYVGNVLPVKNAPLILGSMFKTFNTIALTLGAAVLIYTTVVGLLMTAHEGEFLGKGKWNGLWTPLRLLFGIIALFPMPSGYSILQYFFVWIMIQGVGAADTLWNTTLTYINIAGSPTATIPLDTLKTTGNITQLFQNLTCQASSRAGYSNTYNIGRRTLYYYFCGDPQNAGSIFCRTGQQEMLDATNGPQVTTVNNNVTYSIGPQGQCGSMTYDSCRDVNSATDFKGRLKYVACSAQVEALKAIVVTLGGIANQIVDTDHDYLEFVTNVSSEYKPPAFIKNFCTAKQIKECCYYKPSTNPLDPTPVPCSDIGSFPLINDNKGQDYSNASEGAFNQLYYPFKIQPTFGNSDFLKKAVTFYTENIVSKVTAFINSQPPDKLTDWLADAQRLGWLLAGSFYYRMSASSGNNLDAANPSLIVPPWPNNGGGGYRYNYNGVKYLMATLQAQSEKNSNFASGSMPELKPIGNLVQSASGQLFSSFMNLLTGGRPGEMVKNPLVAIHGFGHDMINIAVISFVVFITVVGIATLLGSIVVSGLGTFVATGIGQMFTVIGMIMMPIIMALIGSLYVFGGTLSVYVPLIPYIFFTLGGIGWFIATVEAMVAAPLVALGIITPGGHDILGHAQPGLMIMLNVLLRPTLMIFGLIASILILNVAITLVNNTFLGVMNIITTGTPGDVTQPGLLELMLFIASYTFLILSIANKSFALIYRIPERIFVYIGGHEISYGEGEIERGVSERFRGAAAPIGEAGAGLAQMAGKKLPEAKMPKLPPKKVELKTPGGEGGGAT